MTRLLELHPELARRSAQLVTVLALEVQLAAWEHSPDWKWMLGALTRKELPRRLRLALTESWKREILGLYRNLEFRAAPSDVDPGWVVPLLDSLFESEAGCGQFHVELGRWVASLAGDGMPGPGDVWQLRLLTADVANILKHGKPASSVQLLEIAVRPQQLITRDQALRRL